MICRGQDTHRFCPQDMASLPSATGPASALLEATDDPALHRRCQLVHRERCGHWSRIQLVYFPETEVKLAQWIWIFHLGLSQFWLRYDFDGGQILLQASWLSSEGPWRLGSFCAGTWRVFRNFCWFWAILRYISILMVSSWKLRSYHLPFIRVSAGSLLYSFWPSRVHSIGGWTSAGWCWPVRAYWSGDHVLGVVIY